MQARVCVTHGGAATVTEKLDQAENGCETSHRVRVNVPWSLAR